MGKILVIIMAADDLVMWRAGVWITMIMIKICVQYGNIILNADCLLYRNEKVILLVTLKVDVD